MVSLLRGLVLLCSSISLGLAAVKYSSEKLNVHIVPHSHDDPGWLKTADQYYYGSNSSIYRAGVQYILDSVITELEKDREKKFVYVEMSFFQRWYFEQTAEKKRSVKALVKSGQLSFANGGWVMHDEAGSHYVSMIDQTTLGHRFLKDEFDYAPRVGWQIDPFGHSATQPSLLSSEVGFDALYFGRIDYQDREIRKQEKRLEFVWRASSSNPSWQVFTGVFSDGNYQPPSGFCFDDQCQDQPIMDDPRLEDYNVDERVQAYIQAILTEQSYSRGNHIMLKMGSDFNYQNANQYFKNLDKLIKHVNAADDRFNLFYSDPTSYTFARADEGLSWTVKTDDFHPYSDCAHCFWGGYYTSRPTLKYFERISSSYLQVLKQLTALQHLDKKSAPEEMKVASDALFKLTAAVGLINHHDALTGTSKQHVAYDYVKILDKAFSEAEAFVSKSVARNAFLSRDSSLSVPKLGSCRLYNESTCPLTESARAGDDILLVLYNPLPRSASQQVSVFLSDEAVPKDTSPSSKASISVLRVSPGKLTPVPSELLKTFQSSSSNPSSAPWTLVFAAEEVPALATATYIVRLVATDSNFDGNALLLENRRESLSGGRDSLVVKSDKVSVSFSKGSGLMNSITRLDTGLTAEVSNDLRYYVSFGSPGIHGRKYSNPFSSASPEEREKLKDPHYMNLHPPSASLGETSSQPSGAYVFRPDKATADPSVTIRDTEGDSVKLEVVEGELITEVRQTFSSWASQIVRLRKGSEEVEIEWTVGPVPIDDDLGKEIITRFSSSLNSELTVSTDASGREFLTRVKNYRPTWEMEVYEPVAGNYYPITAAMYIQDKENKMQLSILTDRSVAAASLNNGEMEAMVHRRLLADDWRGVGEPLNETLGGISAYPEAKRSGDGITVKGSMTVLLSSLDSGMKEVRSLMDKTYLRMKPFFGAEKDAAQKAMKMSEYNNAESAQDSSPLGTELPLNVHLLTLEAWSEDTLLVRLAHQFGVGEDETYSLPTQVDLSALLSSFNPVSAVEMSLSANQRKDEMLKNKVQWATDESSLSISGPPANTKSADEVLVVTINPMEIKTFLVTIKK